MKAWIVFLVSVLLLSANFILAGTTGKIVGTVTDAEIGEGLPGVNVIIEGTTMGASSDLDGYFMILNIPPGIYTLRASMMGYDDLRVTNVKVSIDLTTKQDFHLLERVLDIGGEVTITAERPIVQMDLTSTRATVGDEEIGAMPVEELADVLELQAGITKDPGGKLHMRGGRSTEIVFLIDGVSVTDPFAGEQSVEIENESIEQMQVISGGFNAEYGQALSGVVDMVMKEGRDKYHGQISSYVSDYVSADDEIFLNIDDVNPLDVFNIQGSLSGPVPLFNKNLTFYANARYFDNKGWLYGLRQFTPKDSCNFDAADDSAWSITDVSLPDSFIIGLDDYLDYAESQKYDKVPMNPLKKFSFQGKLAYRFSPTVKFSVGGIFDDVEQREYSHEFKLNPDGNYRRFKNGLAVTPILNHTLSSTTFYTVKLSYINFKYDKYVYEDSTDSRYADPERLEDAGQNAFSTGGTGMWHNHRETRTILGKFDLTSQVNRTHQIKTGAELKRYELELEEFEIVEKYEYGLRVDPFEPVKPPIESYNHNKYHHKPIEFSGYIQDKIELRDMIVNLGVRFDYFDAKSKVPTDLRDPSLTNPIRRIDIYQGGNLLYDDIPYRRNPDDSRALIDPVTGESFTAPADADFIDPAGNNLNYKDWTAKGSWFEDSEILLQFSPRIGISYPITDRGAIYFSYGFFFQKPTFEHLYMNPEFEINTTEAGLNTLMGNTNLKNERTVNYEIGLQQQLGDNVGFFLTGFYKDINNWLGTEIIETYIAGDKYARFVNRDYGNVRGITAALDLRPSRNVMASIDYTYQVAEGNASDPEAQFADVKANRESEIQVVPLDWDQTHTLNVFVSFIQPDNWGVSLIGKLNNGLPYTPTLRGTQGVRASFENSERKPANINFDLKGHKDFRIGGMTYSLFFKVYNLFDARNAKNVFATTGLPTSDDYDIDSAGRAQGINTVDDWYKRPHYYAEPRRVQLGVSIEF